jgi:hypothetical protein
MVGSATSRGCVRTSVEGVHAAPTPLSGCRGSVQNGEAQWRPRVHGRERSPAFQASPVRAGHCARQWRGERAPATGKRWLCRLSAEVMRGQPSVVRPRVRAIARQFKKCVVLRPADLESDADEHQLGRESSFSCSTQRVEQRLQEAALTIAQRERSGQSINRHLSSARPTLGPPSDDTPTPSYTSRPR